MEPRWSAGGRVPGWYAVDLFRSNSSLELDSRRLSIVTFDRQPFIRSGLVLLHENSLGVGDRMRQMALRPAAKSNRDALLVRVGKQALQRELPRFHTWTAATARDL